MKQYILNIFTFIVCMQFNLFAMSKNDCECATIVDFKNYLYRPYIDPQLIFLAKKNSGLISFSQTRVVCEVGPNSFEEIGTVQFLDEKHINEIKENNYMYLANFFTNNVCVVDRKQTGLLVIGLKQKDSSRVTMKFKENI